MAQIVQPDRWNPCLDTRSSEQGPKPLRVIRPPGLVREHNIVRSRRAKTQRLAVGHLTLVMPTHLNDDITSELHDATRPGLRFNRDNAETVRGALHDDRHLPRPEINVAPSQSSKLARRIPVCNATNHNTESRSLRTDSRNVAD